MTTTLTLPDRTEPARRVAQTIGTVKWVLVSLYMLVAVAAPFVGAFMGDGEVFMDGLGVMALSALAALLTWVVFGWAEHALGMLALIARNTSREPTTITV